MGSRQLIRLCTQVEVGTALFLLICILFQSPASQALGIRQPESQPAVLSDAERVPQLAVLSAPHPGAALVPQPSCAPECGDGGTGAMSKVPLTPTALYSYPGSGNTWLRYLLSTASGILTGIVYRSSIDVSTIETSSMRVLVVKTHKGIEKTRERVEFERAIILIRSPYDALLSYFNRLGDYGDVPEQKFKGVRPKEDFKTKWPKYTGRYWLWRDKYLEWSRVPTPIHVIVYDRLVANMSQELQKVFNFLNEPSVSVRIHCAVKDSEGHAHRAKPEWLSSLAVHTDDNKAEINQAIDAVQKALETKTGESFQDFQRWKK